MKRILILVGALIGLQVNAAIPALEDFDTTYFNAGLTLDPWVQLRGNLTNWAKLGTNSLASGGGGAAGLNFQPASAYVVSDYKVTNIYLSNLAPGSIDVWTVPDGHRAMPVAASYSTTNTSGATTVFGLSPKISGTLYYVRANSSITTNAPVNASGGSFIFEPGEVMNTTNTLQGLNIKVTMRYWSTNTPSSPMSARLLGLTSGSTNLLYVCPAGKRAGRSTALFDNAGPVFQVRSATTTPKQKMWIVPNESSVGADHIVFHMSASVSLNSIAMPELQEGDAIYVATDADDAQQNFWFNYAEYTP
jgi:hypothetical protein